MYYNTFGMGFVSMSSITWDLSHRYWVWASIPINKLCNWNIHKVHIQTRTIIAEAWYIVCKKSCSLNSLAEIIPWLNASPLVYTWIYHLCYTMWRNNWSITIMERFRLEIDFLLHFCQRSMELNLSEIGTHPEWLATLLTQWQENIIKHAYNH